MSGLAGGPPAIWTSDVQSGEEKRSIQSNWGSGSAPDKLTHSSASQKFTFFSSFSCFSLRASNYGMTQIYVVTITMHPRFQPEPSTRIRPAAEDIPLPLQS